ncbi:uncharacterized protein K460DRAFT_356185 [Cucurbitaria berberidis CBS 394.84]|uniref:Uncharacterized protein n=1 Tax=Cucurbitaria berberidis CBS 394.84 TaxID=1168544 RepID=A0A9P4GK06_9PLEO|nr:uncharacterized protein K460DRAFT_356185 [Cucurbitaria berberidis CBS 394.84]KAF1846520.1 hypothetical protein K460DRAFT_356185 [Cucurbitaria berberidis CBS 394.84]
MQNASEPQSSAPNTTDKELLNQEVSLPRPPQPIAAISKAHQFKAPARKDAAHLDNNWSAASWRGHSNRHEMLALLQEAGVDISILINHDTTRVTDFIIERRKQREADGIIPPQTVRLSKIDNTKPFGGWDENDETKNAKGKKRARQGTGGRRLASGTTEDEADDEEESQISLATTRSYLLAIKKQALLNINHEIMGFLDDPEQSTTSPPSSPIIHPPRGDTILIIDNAPLISYKAQIAIRKILHHRENIRYWDRQHNDCNKGKDKEYLQERELYHDYALEVISEVILSMGMGDGKAGELHQGVVRLVMDIFCLEVKDKRDG